MLITVKRIKIHPILRLKVNPGKESHVSINDNYQVKSGKSLHNVKLCNQGNSEHQTHNSDRAPSDHRLFSEQEQNLGD